MSLQEQLNGVESTITGYGNAVKAARNKRAHGLASKAKVVKAGY
jgi:outer membrane protein TolC